MTNSFGKNIIPPNETLRLKALEYFDLLDDLPDAYFANLAQIIASVFHTPIALVSLVADKKVHFKGNYGMKDVTDVDRGDSLCSLAILDAEPTVFGDAMKEPCLLSNPLVAGDFGLRFYAGAPITTPEGFNIGTVCIVDKEPRTITIEETELLKLFAKNAMAEIMSRVHVKSIK